MEPFLHFTNRLNKAGFQFMVTGSVAATLYGEPRTTNDIDLVLLLPSGKAKEIETLFPLDEFYCPPLEVLTIEANRESSGHFNLIHHQSGFKADVYLIGNDSLHIWAMRNRNVIELDGDKVPLAPPEYVIVRKLEFYKSGRSEKHLSDIRLMIAVSGELMDFGHLNSLIAEKGLGDVWSEVESET